MGIIVSFYTAISTLVFIISSCLNYQVFAAHDATTPPKYYHPPTPPKPKYHPPPPPPKREHISERVRMVYPIVQRFKKQITRDPKSITDSWVGENVCKYKGFKCAKVPDLKQEAVAAVNFNGFGFAGKNGLSIDGLIDKLPDVTIFHANSNNFTGTIPSGIANLRFLFELDLSNNKYGKEFPMNVLGATNLTFLDLRFNSFEGRVPAQVFNLKVDVLFINNNNFVQTLPENLGTIPALYLTFANNNFTGPIPRSIGQAATNLREVIFLNNQLSGCLPYEIGFLRNATVFGVSTNLLTGPIPHSFGCLAMMERMTLARNNFYGPIPESICMLPNIANLSLSYNYFTKIGPKCMKMIDKKLLDVRMNCIPDLPRQRSEADCKKFFSQKRTCHNVPDESSFRIIPCHDNEPKMTPALAAAPAPAPSHLTYKVLHPHRL